MLDTVVAVVVDLLYFVLNFIAVFVNGQFPCMYLCTLEVIPTIEYLVYLR